MGERSRGEVRNPDPLLGIIGYGYPCTRSMKFEWSCNDSHLDDTHHPQLLARTTQTSTRARAVSSEGGAKEGGNAYGCHAQERCELYGAGMHAVRLEAKCALSA